MSAADWVLDEYGSWNLHLNGAHVWIEKRPPGCNRGHFVANVNGIPSIDTGDSFPRYFMNLDRAKGEMHEWLLWRFSRENRRLGLE